MNKGSMLWIKKIVGILLVLVLLNVSLFPYYKEISLILASYFLLINGRQR
jgi:hypothetical protein